MRSTRHYLFILACAMTSFSGCGQRANDDAGQVRVSLPNFISMRTSDVARQSKNSTLVDSSIGYPSLVAINVSGPGMSSPVFWSWENHDGNSSASPPSDIQLTALRGSDRLVQVLAVYESSGMSFYYDEATTTIGSDPVAVSLTLKNVATSQNLTQGNVVGRFFNSATTGPTAKFNYRFAPPSPYKGASMVVHQGEMFAGWANIFALSNPILTYSFTDGRPLPVPGFAHTNPAFVTTGKRKRMARIYVPSGYQSRGSYSGGLPTNVTLSKEQYLLVGFFGQGPQSQRVCLSSAGVELSGIYRSYDGAGTMPYSPITWYAQDNGGRDRTADSFVENFGGVTGGDSDPNCAVNSGEVTASGTPVPFEDYLYINGQSVANGSDVAGFRGPFRKPVLSTGASSGYSSGSDSFLTITPNASSDEVSVSWKYLPGVVDDLGGVSVFYKTLADASSIYNDEEIRESGDFYRCDDLAAKLGYTERSVAQGQESATITGLSASDLNKTRFVVCVKDKLGKFWGSAVSGYYYSYGGGSTVGGTPCPGGSCGGSGGGPQVAQIKIFAVDGTEANSGYVNLGRGICLPLKILAFDASGSSMSVYPSINLTVSLTQASGTSKLHLDGNCSGAGNDSLNLSYFSGWGMIYLKVGSDSMQNHEVSVSAASGLASATLNQYKFVDVSATANRMKMVLPASIYAYNCNTGYLVAYEESSGTLANPSGTAASFSYPTTPPGLNFYNAYDLSCAQGIVGGDSISAGSVSRAFNFRYDGANASLAGLTTDSTSATALSSNLGITGGFTQSPASVTVLQPGPVHSISVFANASSINVGECVGMKFRYYDANGRAPIPPNDGQPTPTFYAINGTLNATMNGTPTGILSSSSSCSSGNSGGFTISGGLNYLNDTPIYFKATDTGTVRFSVQDLTIAAVPATWFKNWSEYSVNSTPVYVGLHNQSWSASTFTATSVPYVFYEDVPAPIQLRAVNSSNMLITTMGETVASNLGISAFLSNSTMAITPISWSAGNGSAMVTMSNLSLPWVWQKIQTGMADKYQTTMSADAVVLSKPTQIKTLSGGYFSTYSGGVCEPIVVYLAAADGYSAAAATSSFTVNLTSLININLYTDMNCSTAHSGSLSFTQGQSTKVVYGKASGSGVSFSLSGNMNGTSLTGSYSATASSTAPSYPNDIELRVHYSNPNNFWRRFDCHPFFLRAREISAYTTAQLTGDLSVNASTSGFTAWFYTTDDCSDTPQTSRTYTIPSSGADRGYVLGWMRVIDDVTPPTKEINFVSVQDICGASNNLDCGGSGLSDVDIH